MTPQELADAAAQAMYENDHATKALGIVLEAVRPGYARMSMVVPPDLPRRHDFYAVRFDLCICLQ
jgi:acyl-CoA thioesterase